MAVHVDKLVTGLHAATGLVRGDVRVVEVLAYGQAVIGGAGPHGSGVHDAANRLRVEVVGLSKARLPQLAEIGIDEVTDLREGPIDVKAVALVGNDQRQDPAGPQDVRQVVQPTDRIWDVFNDM